MIKTIDHQSTDLLFNVYNSIGNYFKQTQNFQTAVEYYVMAKNTAEIINCYCRLDDYDSLENLLDTLPAGDPLIAKIAKKFATDGVFPSLVTAYEKVRNYYTMQLSVSIKNTIFSWDNIIQPSSIAFCITDGITLLN